MPTLPPGLDQEAGYATNTGSISGWPVDQSEHVPELLYPLSIQVYDRMRRGDDQIKAILNAISLPLLRAPWRIDPNGADPAVVNLVAGDLNLPIEGQAAIPTGSRRRGQFSWHDHLRIALLHLPYGHMGFEIVCDTARGDGLAHLERLSPRMPVTIGRFETDRSGRLLAIYQFPTTVPDKGFNSSTIPTLDKKSGMVRIDASRLVWYVNELEGADWQGTSVLRACYGAWLLKQRAMKVNAQKDERNGLGIPWVENPVGVQDISQGQQLAEQLRAGENAGASLPGGAKLHLQGVEGTLPDILASINYYNEAMSRVMLTQFLNLGTTRTGSRALGDSFIDFFKLSLDALGDNIVSTATEQIIEPLVAWNFGEQAATPRLVVDAVDLETDLPPDSLVALTSAGVLTNDEGLEHYVRERFDLPPLTGPTRPATPPTAAFVLPPQPVLARGRRRREVRAKASGARADQLEEADRARTHVETAQRALLRPAWLSLMSHADLTPVLDVIDGRTVLAAVNRADGTQWQPVLLLVVRRQLDLLRGTAAGSRVTSVVAHAIQAGHAQGDVQARGFLRIEDGQSLDPLPPYDAAASIDGWWDDTLGATSNRLTDALAGVLADADELNRNDLLDAAEIVLDDDVDAGFYLDDAISWALSDGAMSRYNAAGVAQVEWLTAEDGSVDEECISNEAGSPYPIGSAPTVPAHYQCRCAIAPVV